MTNRKNFETNLRRQDAKMGRRSQNVTHRLGEEYQHAQRRAQVGLKVVS